jgi:hypothetical protein
MREVGEKMTETVLNGGDTPGRAARRYVTLLHLPS